MSAERYKGTWPQLSGRDLASTSFCCCFGRFLSSSLWSYFGILRCFAWLSEERMGYPPSPSTPSESDKIHGSDGWRSTHTASLPMQGCHLLCGLHLRSVSTGGRGVSHKRCATHPGHEEVHGVSWRCMHQRVIAPTSSSCQCDRQIGEESWWIERNQKRNPVHLSASNRL